MEASQFISEGEGRKKRAVCQYFQSFFLTSSIRGLTTRWKQYRQRPTSGRCKTQTVLQTKNTRAKMQISIKGTAQNRCNIQDAFCLHVILAIPQCFRHTVYKGSVYLKLFYQTSLQRQLPYKQTFLFSMGFSIYQVTLLSFAWLAWDTKQASQVIVSNLKKHNHCVVTVIWVSPYPKNEEVQILVISGCIFQPWKMNTVNFQLL